MGLIRKTLAVGTVGIVSDSSKKQRVAQETRAAVDQLAHQAVALNVAMADTPEARRAALKFELAQMPRGMNRNMRQRKRARQIERELSE